MARVNLHAAMHAEVVIYDRHGDDLLSGLIVTITAESAKAMKYTPGEINWIDVSGYRDLGAKANVVQSALLRCPCP